MKVVLMFLTNKVATEVTLEANQTMTIGRSSRSDQKIPDELMSSTHCQLSLKPPVLEILDLDSKNGTYLNGIRIEQSEVFTGDEIRIGGTKVTLLTEKMDRNSVDALTFPGMSKERIGHELRVDFTGARIANQAYSQSPKGVQASHVPTVNKEIEVRKKIQSKIKLSKQEIKLRNKVRASMASTLDVVFLIMMIAMPLIVTNIIILFNAQALRSYRLPMMLASEVIFVGLYYVVNFKLLRFTLGEKFSGLEKIYEAQD